MYINKGTHFSFYGPKRPVIVAVEVIVRISAVAVIIENGVAYIIIIGIIDGPRTNLREVTVKTEVINFFHNCYCKNKFSFLEY